MVRTEEEIRRAIALMYHGGENMAELRETFLGAIMAFEWMLGEHKYDVVFSPTVVRREFGNHVYPEHLEKPV